MTVASAPWTAVHVKQHYNAQGTCLPLLTSFTGTLTRIFFCEINWDFRKNNCPVRGLAAENQAAVQ